MQSIKIPVNTILKKTTLILLHVLFLFCYLSGNSQQNTLPVESISFTRYGPIAFDSFWRLPEDNFKDYPVVRLPSRISTDQQESFFFTQYFIANAPIGSSHSLTVKFPMHYFQVTSQRAQELGMLNTSGTEIGDIDIIFNVRLFKKLTGDKLVLYSTAEMHTAPTGRDNRQFIDFIKLLGTLNGVYSVIDNSKHTLRATVGIGGGGWDDLSAPYQKHALKISSKLSFDRNLKNNQGIGAFIGKTLIYAEGRNNRGIYLKTGVNYWKTDKFQLGLHTGLIKYLVSGNSFVRQYELEAAIPLTWFKKSE